MKYKKSLHREPLGEIAARENTHKYFITKLMYPIFVPAWISPGCDSHVPLRELEQRTQLASTRASAHADHSTLQQGEFVANYSIQCVVCYRPRPSLSE